MKAALLSLIGDWVSALAHRPLLVIALTMIAALLYLGYIGGGIGAKLAGIGGMSAGPILIVSGLITLGVCALWAAVDGVFWALHAPYLSERILMWLAPDGMPEDALRQLIDVLPGHRLVLPAFIALPIAMFAAGTLQGLIAWMFGRTLAELIALETKPDDVIARENKEQAKTQQGDAAEGKRPETPLSDHRLGRVYKRFGFWTRLDRVELRFLRWQVPLVRGLLALAAIAITPVALRDLPIPLWVGVAVLVAALSRNAVKPPKEVASAPPAPEPKAKEPVRAGPDTPFVELPELANRLAAADRMQALLPVHEPPAAASGRATRAVLRDILAAVGANALHAHQSAALDAYLERRSVLFATASGSGRRTLAEVLVLYTLLAEAERVLVVCADRDAAREAASAFAERARATHWAWNLLAVDLCERAGAVDPELAVPSLVFADPEALHRRLLGSPDRWRELLVGLGLIVVPRIDRYSGVGAAHLAHLFRRLDRAVRRARAPTEMSAMLDDDPADRIRVFATSDPGFADVGRYTERVAARTFVVIGPERDVTPSARRASRVVVPPSQPLALRDLARKHGFTAELVGYGDVLTEEELAARVPPREADVVIARTSAARYAALPALVEHLGATVLYHPDHEPLAEHLAASQPALDYRPALVAHPRSSAVERAHLFASIAEAEVTLDQLSATFSRELLAVELAALREQGRLAERECRILDPKTGTISRTRCVRLATSEDVHRGTSFATCAVPYDLVERSTGTTVASLEGPRAACAAYPGRVLVRGGRRYIVLPSADQDQFERRRIVCEAIAPPAITTPVRRLELAVTERRSRRREQGPGAALLEIGGAGFWLQTRDVDVVETIQGTRTFAPDGSPREEVGDDSPLRCEYATRAALLVFPSEPFGEISAATLHALLHLARSALPSAVRYSEEDLDVTATAVEAGGSSRPALAFVDLHPGGAGFADAITLDRLRPTLHLAQDLLTASKERVFADWMCRAPADRRATDVASAATVLARLLGR